MNAEQLADSLNQLTANWTPAPGVSQESLNAARVALASSLVAGKSLADIHAIQTSLSQQPPENPKLVASLLNLANVVLQKPAPTVAYIRSAQAASLNNPSGIPDWARSASVVQSFGPFLDSAAVYHWVNLIPITVATQFAFGSSASPFGIIPLETVFALPSTATKFNLGSGSLWFLANLLNAAFPTGAFTGFDITGGTLSSTGTMTLTSGVYVIPTTDTLTLTVHLKPAVPPTTLGTPGADAAAATFTPPANVTLTITHASAGFSAIAVASVWAYSSEVQVIWGGAAATTVPNQPFVLIPCSSTPLAFAFSTVQSQLFIPSGTASIQSCGWALPLVTSAITSLPQAGPGSALLSLGTGASLTTSVQPEIVAITNWEMFISTGELLVIAGGTEPVTQLNQTIYQLWPLAVNPTINATVSYFTSPIVLYSYFAKPSEEVLATLGEVVPNIDRPLSATGARFAYGSAALLEIIQLKHSTLVAIIGARKDAPSAVYPLALENALLGVDAPEGFILAAELAGGPNTTQFKFSTVAYYFNMRWLLPTLPDPYAANFNLTVVEREKDTASAGTLIGAVTWAGTSSQPTVGFLLLPPGQSPTNPSGTTPFPTIDSSDTAVLARQTRGGPSGAALLDLSTRVDLFGVAVAPEIAALLDPALTVGGSALANFNSSAATSQAAPVAAVVGMALWLNRSLVTTFALPQFSWEPMESSAAGQLGPVACEPASDGLPLLITAPNNQQLVPFQPDLVLLDNILAVEEGKSFAGVFSLPFGIDAAVIQPNQVSGTSSTFLAKGGRFGLNRPRFRNAFPPSPPTATVASATPVSTTGPKEFNGAITLLLKPENPGNSDAFFPGVVALDSTGATPGYGTMVLGFDKTTQATDVGDIFSGEFASGGSSPKVPLRRIDFSGYGASTFSEWIDPHPVAPAVTKVQFEASIGRTALDVIQVISVIYPWCIQVVRTITMQRQNAGWVLRTDSGWQAASAGTFAFPSSGFTGRMNPGPLVGAYNVRNIQDTGQKYVAVDSVTKTSFDFRAVTFNTDFVFDKSLNVVSGGFAADSVGGPANSSATASAGVMGYLQLGPDGTEVTPEALRALLAQTGPVSPLISCTVEAGSFGAHTSGTIFRCSAFEVNAITQAAGGAGIPAFGAALRGAPQIPNAGGWSMGVRAYTNPAPSALPSTFPVPLVRPAGNSDYWYIADVADILQLTQPSNYYSLLHSTGTQKVLFESPRIPTSSSIPTPPPTPGLQFPQPQPPQSGGAPGNQGSPNLGDLASILNSTGLFPDLSAALSLMVGGATEQINTIKEGFQYTKSYQFPAGQSSTIIDLSVMKIEMLYSEAQQQVSTTQYPGGPTPNPLPAAKPTTLTYMVNSAPASGAPTWSLTIGPFTLQVIVPLFGSSPILWITGGFYADSHTKPGVTNLNIQFGSVLSIVQQVFSALQTVAKFLPGGSTSSLDVALSDGILTVQDTFCVADMPLGLGDLTDISLDVGLNVTLQPLSVDFSVGIGSFENPFNWIATPLAGNGMMSLGVQNSKPDFTIQAGIGLGIAIDLGIASGSASVTLAFNLNIDGNSVTLIILLTGQASVSVLDGLASVSLTLTAGLGISLNPAIPLPTFSLSPPQLTIPSIDVGLIAVCSVGIHLSICWVVSVSWDGSWQFRQDIHTPSLTVDA